MLEVIVSIVVLIAYFFYRSSDAYKNKGVFVNEILYKRIYTNIYEKVCFMGNRIPIEIKGHRLYSVELQSLIFKVLDSKKLTNRDMKEMERRISLFYNEFKNIGDAEISYEDKEELEKELAVKLVEYLNNQITNLKNIVESNFNESEKDDIRKRINKL